MVEQFYALSSLAVIAIMGWILWLFIKKRADIPIDESGYVAQFRYASITRFLRFVLIVFFMLSCFGIVFQIVFAYNGFIKVKSISLVNPYLNIQLNLLFSLLILYHLQFIFYSFEKKYIFTVNNFRRMKYAGTVIIIGKLITILLHCGSLNFSLHDIASINMALFFLLNQGKGLFFGVMVFVIAEVFRCSIEIKQENDLTV